MTDIESFIDQLANLYGDYKLAYNSLRHLKGVNVNFSLIQKRMTISIFIFYVIVAFIYLFIPFNYSFSIKIRVLVSIENTYRIIFVLSIIIGILSIDNN